MEYLEVYTYNQGLIQATFHSGDHFLVQGSLNK